jgi:hypothetical protein
MKPTIVAAVMIALMTSVSAQQPSPPAGGQELR